MTIMKFSKDEVQKLKLQISNKNVEIGVLESKSAADIWTAELDVLVDLYNKWDAECVSEYNDLMCSKKKKTVKKTVKKSANESV